MLQLPLRTFESPVFSPLQYRKTLYFCVANTVIPVLSERNPRRLKRHAASVLQVIHAHSIAELKAPQSQFLMEHGELHPVV